MVYKLHYTAGGVKEPKLLLIIAKYLHLPASEGERKGVVLVVPEECAQPLGPVPGSIIRICR